MNFPETFVHFIRTIDPNTGIHYLDAIDEKGNWWHAEQSHNIEKWLVYTQPWKKRTQ